MCLLVGVLIAMPVTNPRKWWRRGLVWFLLVVLLFWLGIIFMPSAIPENLGVIEGKLRECPDSPNCVSTEATDASHLIPRIEFTGTAADARARLIRVVKEMPRTKLVTEKENYLHFECRSRLFSFVDDLEFFIDSDTRMIQVRSASRIGYSDLGVNRARVNQVRDAFDSRNAQ